MSRPQPVRNVALAQFLRDRRARVDPEVVGLRAGPRRRVAGLRREEVAQLADVSVDYYSRLEQGRQPTASPSVLSGVARALRLTDDERRHLFTLARVPGDDAAPVPADTGLERVRQLLTVFGDTPVMVFGPFVDIVDANPAAAFLFTDFARLPPPHRNGVRWMLLAPEARDRYREQWESAAGELIGMLRLHAGQHPDSPRLAELIGELGAHSALFRRLWEEQTVSQWAHHHKVLRHPGFGSMAFTNEFVSVDAAPHLHVVVMAPADPTRFTAALAARS